MNSKDEKITKLLLKVSELEGLIANQQLKNRSKLDYLLKEIHKLGGGYKKSNQKCKKGSCDCEE